MLVISPRTENGLLVVKDHGNTDFVNPSRMRSSRKHHFCEKTKSISTTFSLKKGDGDVRYGVAERDLLDAFMAYIQKKIMIVNCHILYL